MRTQVQSLAELSGLRIWRGSGCGRQRQLSLEPETMGWLGCGTATQALISPQAKEPPYAKGGAQKKKKKKKEPNYYP